MDKSTVRSIGIFTVVAMVLLLVVLGGVYFAKNRNAQFADKGVDSAPTVQSGQPPAEPVKPPESSQSTQPITPQPQASAQQSLTAQQDPAAEAASRPGQVPATGLTEEVLFTVVLMMLAAYFGLVIRKSKLAYRR